MLRHLQTAKPASDGMLRRLGDFFLRTYLISVLMLFALFVWVSERNAVTEDALVTRIDAIFSPLADNKSPASQSWSAKISIPCSNAVMECANFAR